jgi:hypothetical protein
MKYLEIKKRVILILSSLLFAILAGFYYKVPNADLTKLLLLSKHPEWKSKLVIRAFDDGGFFSLSSYYYSWTSFLVVLLCSLLISFFFFDQTFRFFLFKKITFLEEREQLKSND